MGRVKNNMNIIKNDINLPETSYERDMNNNYMILTSRDFFGEVTENNNDYRKKMVLENKIPRLIPVKHRLANGEMRYYYMINSLVPFGKYYDKREITYGELKQILRSCVCLFDGLEEYLLDGSQIILKPDYIYIDTDKCELHFVCYPEYEEDIRESFREFIDLLLTKIDHKDHNAVILGYKLYRYTKNPNYTILEIANIVESHTAQEISDNFANTPNQAFYQQPANTDMAVPNIAPPAAQTIKQPPLYAATPEYTEVDTMEVEQTADIKNKKADNNIGIIICLSIALIAMAVIVGDRRIGLIGLNSKTELYLYGIVAVSLVQTAILYVARAKKKKALC
jgi:flavodoxin